MGNAAELTCWLIFAPRGELIRMPCCTSGAMAARLLTGSCCKRWSRPRRESTEGFLETVASAWMPEPASGVEVANILAWAVDTHVLTRDEIALRVRATLGGAGPYDDHGRHKAEPRTAVQPLHAHAEATLDLCSR